MCLDVTAWVSVFWKETYGLLVGKFLVWMVRSLYGLKQAPQAWYFKLDQYLRDSRVIKTYLNPLAKSKIVTMIY